MFASPDRRGRLLARCRDLRRRQRSPALLALLAQRLHATALPAGPKPVWVTELNWESSPQVNGGVAPAEQPAWISRALHRLWVAGIGMASWQFLIDPYPGALASTPSGAIITFPRPAGLYSAGPGGDPEAAVAKPFLAGFQPAIRQTRCASIARMVACLGAAGRGRIRAGSCYSVRPERARGGRSGACAAPPTACSTRSSRFAGKDRDAYGSAGGRHELGRRARAAAATSRL